MRNHEGMLLVINAGSATVKTRLFDSNLREIARLNADYGGFGGVQITGRDSRGKAIEQSIAGTGTARQALLAMFAEWQKQLAESQMPLAAIGHRIVHGGSDFASTTLMTPAVSERLAVWMLMHPCIIP